MKEFVSPPVDGGVTLSEPADSWEFVFLTSSTEIHDHVVFCNHQIQSSYDVPADTNMFPSEQLGELSWSSENL